jgi:hypothetical protein
VKPNFVDFCYNISYFSGGSVTVHMTAEQALVFRAARDHFLPEVSRLERSGLDPLDVALECGFEGCRGQMANRRMPLHLPDAAGSLVRRRLGVCRECYGCRHDGDRDGFHFRSPSADRRTWKLGLALLGLRSP